MQLARFIVASCLVASCCGDAHSIGAPCSIDAPLPRGFGVAILSPALECASHLCLVTEGRGAPSAICTVECSSDDDCAGMGRLYCRDGYRCTQLGLPHSVCACV